MGSGDRAYVLEENLRKLWILLHWNRIEKLDKHQNEILSMIKGHFTTGKHVLVDDFSSLQKISDRLNAISRETGVDLIAIVENFSLEREDSGRAHALVSEKGGRMVFMDPE